MTEQQFQEKYNALSEEEREAFDAKMLEYAAILFNPGQGPYDNAHWHKVPPSATVATEEAPSAPAVKAPKATSAPAPPVVSNAKKRWRLFGGANA